MSFKAPNKSKCLFIHSPIKILLGGGSHHCNYITLYIVWHIGIFNTVKGMNEKSLNLFICINHLVDSALFSIFIFYLNKESIKINQMCHKDLDLVRLYSWINSSYPDSPGNLMCGNACYLSTTGD